MSTTCIDATRTDYRLNHNSLLQVRERFWWSPNFYKNVAYYHPLAIDSFPSSSIITQLSPNVNPFSTIVTHLCPVFNHWKSRGPHRCQNVQDITNKSENWWFTKKSKIFLNILIFSKKKTYPKKDFFSSENLKKNVSLKINLFSQKNVIENQNFTFLLIQNISKIRRKLISSSSSKSNKNSGNIDGLLCLYVYKKYSKHVEY